MTVEVEGNVFRVKLVNQRTARRGLANQERVVFEATPDVNESRTTNYSTIDPVHMPGSIYVYKNTTARTFSVSNARLISRTPAEAEGNLRRLWLLRGWMMPRFGRGSSTLSDTQRKERETVKYNLERPAVKQELPPPPPPDFGTELLGAPPEVLYFSAYSKGNGGVQTREHISRVPVVIQTLNIPYPSDVDYILSESGVPMPTIMTIDVTLLETHSAQEYERFSLEHYKKGTLPNF